MTAESKTNTCTGGILSLVMFTAMAIAFSSCTSPTPPPPPGVDTTSHEFMWRIDTLGDGSSSTLYDVTIINDTLAYAVGEIYLKDSTGQFEPNAWNAARWNGQRWQLLRIPFIGPCAIVIYPPIKAICALSVTTIFVSNGGSIVRFDGSNATMDCGMNASLTGAINKLLATSSSNVFAVGNSGTIVHYNGSAWHKIESGTTSDFRDIWGADRIVAVASSPSETKILVLSDQSVTDLLPWPAAYRLRGAWVSPSLSIYASGYGIWKFTGSSWQLMDGVPATIFYTASIRGNGDNDIFTGAWGGVLMHYNGKSWHTFTEIPSAFSFYSLAVKHNTVAAVGFTGGLFVDKAAVVIGRRLN